MASLSTSVTRRERVQTPWGVADSFTEKAPGIVFYGTPGHGGFHLDRKEQAKVRAALPDFQTFAGGPWYEEDQDWAIVALVFPELFNDYNIRAAVRTVKGAAKWERERTANPQHVSERPSDNWIRVEAWLESSDAGKSILGRVERWEFDHANDWTIGSMGSPPNGYGDKCWYVGLNRVGDGAHKSVVFSGYPDQYVYTDADVARLKATPLVAKELVTQG